MFGNNLKVPKVPPPPSDGRPYMGLGGMIYPDPAPVDRERNRLLFQAGREARGSIQGASVSQGRAWEVLDMQVLGCKEKRFNPSWNVVEFDFGTDVVSISMDTIASLSRYEVIEIIQRKRQAFRLQDVNARELRETISSFPPVAAKPEEPPAIPPLKAPELDIAWEDKS